MQGFNLSSYKIFDTLWDTQHISAQFVTISSKFYPKWNITNEILFHFIYTKVRMLLWVLMKIKFKLSNLFLDIKMRLKICLHIFKWIYRFNVLPQCLKFLKVWVLNVNSKYWIFLYLSILGNVCPISIYYLKSYFVSLCFIIFGWT